MTNEERTKLRIENEKRQAELVNQCEASEATKRKKPKKKEAKTSLNSGVRICGCLIVARGNK